MSALDSECEGTLIEYRVQDVVGWRAIFDQDPVGREQHGVTRHCIYKDSKDPNPIMPSREFPSAEEAKTFRKALEPVWAVSGAGQAWVLRRRRSDGGPIIGAGRRRFESTPEPPGSVCVALRPNHQRSWHERDL